MPPNDDTPTRVRWARLRFLIIGPLLASPADPGELKSAIDGLAARSWQHPQNGEAKKFSAKTIERWFYSARKSNDPIEALARKVPSHAGTHPTMIVALGEALALQHKQHPGWTFQLHYDNLKATARGAPALGKVPSYPTVCRYMKAHGLLRMRKTRLREGDQEFVPRETRSFEVAYVHGLWHLDFHQGSRAILTTSGEWKKPQLLGILDDHSRLCCHLQWYFEETAEALIHGFSQAIHKRGLPRSLLTDNGAAMIAAETRQGLERLGIVHETTLPYSPEQNGKQESFWGNIEGRVLPMLEGEEPLTLELLNVATQAWVEQEYHREEHSELGEPPLTRYLRGPSVGREGPSAQALRRAFRMELTRTQRRSDGTVTVLGVRFEVPSAYRALIFLRVRAARWDLSSVELVDPRSGVHLATLLPLDKTKNAEGIRRVINAPRQAPLPPSGIAPLMRELMAEYAATGLPPAFIPKDSSLPVPSAPSHEDS